MSTMRALCRTPPARPLGGFRLMSGCQHPSPRLSRGAWFLDPVPSPATDVAFHARSTCFSRPSLLFQFQLYIISNSSISVHIVYLIYALPRATLQLLLRQSQTTTEDICVSMIELFPD